MAFWRELLDEVGGFDPVYTSAGDDVDLCWRVLDRGWEIGFHPAALVWHHRRPGCGRTCASSAGTGGARRWWRRATRNGSPAGTARWRGRIYYSFPAPLGRQRIYRGPTALRRTSRSTAAAARRSTSPTSSACRSRTRRGDRSACRATRGGPPGLGALFSCRRREPHGTARPRRSAGQATFRFRLGVAPCACSSRSPGPGDACDIVTCAPRPPAASIPGPATPIPAATSSSPNGRPRRAGGRDRRRAPPARTAGAADQRVGRTRRPGRRLARCLRRARHERASDRQCADESSPPSGAGRLSRCGGRVSLSLVRASGSARGPHRGGRSSCGYGGPARRCGASSWPRLR